MNAAARWLRANLFSGWPSALATLAIAWLAWKLVPPFVDWAFVEAVWRSPNSGACREAQGACWAFIGEKHRFMLFGTYPFEHHWRPALATAVLVLLWVFSSLKRFWNWWLSAIWVAGLAHVVTVQAGDQILTELITEDTDLLPKVGLATSFRFRGERDHVQSFGNGMRYILSTQVERMTPQLFPATHRDYVHYAQNRGMFVSFDDLATDGLSPFSFVDFDARDHELHIHAFHAFPDEMTLLKTQSIFEIGKPRMSAHG